MNLIFLIFTLGINDFVKEKITLTVKTETEKMFFVEENKLNKSKFLKTDLGIIKTPVESFTGMSLTVLCHPEQEKAFENKLINDFAQWLNQYHDNYINILLSANKHNIPCPADVDLSNI